MSSQPVEPGRRLGKYEVLAHIATGGMGTVYKARDTELGRLVALKVLSKETASRGTSLERFRREARHAAQLSHRNIVTLYEFGQAEETYFLALEYVKGVDLGAYLARRGRLEPEEARRIVIQAARALDHAFQQGIVHRDIKPSNFLLTHKDNRMVVKMTDLGLARNVDEDEFRVTRAGSTVGTVDYLSPEQARDSRAADVRSDIYSLGCTLYHMLGGSPPFPEGGLGERIYKHMETEPPDVRQFNPRVSLDFWGLLRRMLAKKPEDRYQTPAELLKELKHVRVEAPSAEFRSIGEPTRVNSLSPPGLDTQTTKVLSQPAPLTSGVVSTSPTSSDSPFGLSSRSGEMQAAARQFEHAGLAQAGDNPEYALQLLLSCCKLDPGNLVYRQTLRRAGRTLSDQKRLGGWFSTLTNLPARRRIKAAKRARDHGKVLDLGEEILTRNPKDIAVQMDMAEAAEALGFPEMAVWLLEEASQQDIRHTGVLRQLARLYEQQKQFARAITVWEMVRRADPHDADAGKMINDLAARDTIARGNYKQ